MVDQAQFDPDYLKWARDHTSQAIFKSHEAAMNFARDALKGLVVINGAAAAAILALISQVVTKCATVIPALTPVLTCFALGVLCGGIATGLSYIAQVLFTMKAEEALAACEDSVAKRWGNGHQIAAIAFGLAGYIAFAIGCWNAAAALKSFLWGSC